MTSNYSIRLNGADQLLAHPGLSASGRAKLMRRALIAGGQVLEAGLKRRIPVRSGQTRSRISGRLSIGANRMSYVVGGKSITASGFNILRGLEEGTGIYGPKGARITPKQAKALRWVPSRPVSGTPTGGAIYRRSVRGMRPVRPFARTRREDGPRAVQVFRRVFAQQWVAATR